MKIGSVIALLFLWMNMAGQDTAHVHTFGGGSYEEAKCIAPYSDGGFILAGTTGSQQEATTNAYVIKTDNDLNCLWHLNHGAYGVEKLSDVMEDDSGNIVAVGYASVLPDSGYDVFVIKLDASGNIIWEQNFGGSGWEFADEVVAHPDGGYVLAGHQMDGTGGSDAMLMHVGIDGNLLNVSTLGSSFDDAFLFLSVHDSILVAAGSIGISDSSEYAWTVEFDLDFNVVSSDTIFTYENSRMEYMDFHGDTVFTLGTYFIDSLNVRGSFFGRSESGISQWSFDAYNFEAREIRYSGGWIYLPGTNSFFGLGGSAASICLLNEYGNFIDCPSFGDVGDEGFCAMSFIEGVPVLIGSSNSYSVNGDNDVYAVMLSDSMVYGDYTLDISHEDCFMMGNNEFAVSWAPLIEFRGDEISVHWTDEFYTAELFDMRGNAIVRSEGRDEVILPVKNCNCDIYVLRIIGRSEAVFQKIFLCIR
jgi:hypothetical protein